MVERHVGVVRSGGKLSDGCNLPGESVNGRVAGGGGFWVPIVRQEVFQMGYTFGGKKASKWVTHLEGESDPNGWHMDLEKEKIKLNTGSVFARACFRSFSSTAIDRGIGIGRFGVEEATFDFCREIIGAPAEIG